MNYYLERFEKIYDILYSYPEIEEMIYFDGDEEKSFFERNKKTVRELVKLRGDFFSSDREVKALILAVDRCRI